MEKSIPRSTIINKPKYTRKVRNDILHSTTGYNTNSIYML
jgi:hypothetical protein